MQHQLHLIRILVTVTLNPENNPVFLSDDRSTMISELTLTREKLFTAIRDTVFGDLKTSVVTRQLRLIQYDCTELLNVLTAYKKPENEAALLYEASTTCLEHILEYIKNEHAAFFSFHAPMPSRHYQEAIEELKQAYAVLKMALKKFRIPQELSKLITEFINSFMSAPGCTYRHLAYMKMLINRIIHLHAEDGDYTKMLKEQLIYLRFNELDFVGSYVHLIRKEVSELYDIPEQYEFLCRQLKWLFTLPESTEDHYHPSRPGLKKILISYLTAELDFLERNRNLHPEKTTELNGKNYRVKLTVSASVLAYFIRLLMDTDLVISKPRTLLLEFVSRYFQTIGIGSDCLSAGSLETKYKQVSQNTVIAVCALLKRMLRKAEQQLLPS